MVSQWRRIVAAFLLGAALFTTVPVWGQDLNTLLTYFISDLRSGTFSIGTGKDIVISSNGDGAMTITANGDGSDEAITVDLDDTSNEATWSSTTGVVTWRLPSVTSSAHIRAGDSATAEIGWVNRGVMVAPADGEVSASNWAGTIAAGIRARFVVEANTGTKAPAATEAREWYTNTGDGDGSIINLPDDPTVGLSYNVAVTAAQTITINTGTGETIWLAGSTCGTDIAGSDTGASLLIVAVAGGSGGIWHAIGSGTWTC